MEPVVDAVITRTPLQFIRAGTFDLASPPPPHNRPDFSPCGHVFRSWLHTPRYLAALAGYEFKPRAYRLKSGEMQGTFDQRQNPETVVVSLGALGGDRCLIAGEISTLGEAEAAHTLMRAFRAEIARHFDKVHAFLVGDEAMSLLKGGWRLTCDITAPQDADLLSPTE